MYPSYLNKKIPIFKSYLTVKDTRFQSDYCGENFFFHFISWARVLIFPKWQNADTNIPIYQQDGAVHNISNFRKDFNKFFFVIKCIVNTNRTMTIMLVMV